MQRNNSSVTDRNKPVVLQVGAALIQGKTTASASKALTPGETRSANIKREKDLLR